MPSLITLSRQVPDPGTENAQRHSHLDMLVTAQAALVCGAESCVGFARFAEGRVRLLQEFLALRMGCRAMTRSAGWSGCGRRRHSRGCLIPFWTVRCRWAGGAGDQWQDAAPVVRPRGGTRAPACGDGPPLHGQAGPARPVRDRLRPVRSPDRREHGHGHTLPCLPGPADIRSRRESRRHPLIDREQPLPGAGCGFRRGPRPQPQRKTGRKTAAFCESLPSTSCEKPAPNSPSPARRKDAGWSGDVARTILGRMR
ncbi:MAG: transposase family protein [Rhodobacter sp.]|nr:transposase family protein [Rhodobacter sp.]